MYGVCSDSLIISALTYLLTYSTLKAASDKQTAMHIDVYIFSSVCLHQQPVVRGQKLRSFYAASSLLSRQL